MALNMRTSQAGLDVIKAFEGFRARSEALPNGRWIIGYGHMRRARKGIRISETEAEAILREYDLPPVERYVMRCVLAPMSQNEFDALVSLAFNIGPKAFASSDVVAGINGGNRLEAAEAFDLWRQAKIGGRVQIVDALVRRRAAEKALFLNAPGRMPVASSRLYRALHDSQAIMAPPETREILVEHHGERADTRPQIEAQPAERGRTATEEAAESVRQQMVRILGETSPAPTSDEGSTDGASPEEITAAISELAGGDQAPRVQKSVWPQREDLPPPPFLDTGTSQTGAVEPQPQLAPEMIDDLEEVQVSKESIERAIEVNHAMEVEARTGSFLAAFPFAVLALIGFALAGYGVASQFGLVGSEIDYRSGVEVFLPIFLILLGLILFGVMGYYFVRTLVRDD
nr:glycoside hydrolase family protein [Hyphomonas sp. Mor2]